MYQDDYSPTVYDTSSIIVLGNDSPIVMGDNTVSLCGFGYSSYYDNLKGEQHWPELRRT